MDARGGGGSLLSSFDDQEDEAVVAGESRPESADSDKAVSDDDEVAPRCQIVALDVRSPGSNVLGHAGGGGRET